MGHHEVGRVPNRLPQEIIESLRLKKTSKIIKSNHQHFTSMPAKSMGNAFDPVGIMVSFS